MLPYYLKANSWIWNTLPIFIAPLILTLIVFLISKLACKERFPSSHFLGVYTAVLVGLTVGFLAGFSTRSAVDVVLPALLGLLGAALPFIFSTKKFELNIATILILLLTGSVLIGTQWGYNQAYAAKVARRSADYLIRQAEMEALVISERTKLGLKNTELEVKPLPSDGIE